MRRVLSNPIARLVVIVLTLGSALAAVVSDVSLHTTSATGRIPALALNDSGNAAIGVRLDAGKRTALFLVLADGSRLPVAVAGQPSTVPGYIYDEIRGFDFNNRSNLIFEARIADPETGAADDALFFYSLAQRRVLPILPPGYLEAGQQLWVADRFGLNDKDQAVMAVDVFPPCPSEPCAVSEGEDRLLLYEADKRELTELARDTGENAFHNFGRPDINNQGKIALAAQRTPGAAVGIYRWAAGGALLEVLPPGRAVELPESPTLHGVRDLILSDTGLIVFVASFLRNLPPRGGVFAITADNRFQMLAYDDQEIGGARFPLHSRGIFSTIFDGPSLVSVQGSDEIVLGATDFPSSPGSGTTIVYLGPESTPVLIIDGTLELAGQDLRVRPVGSNNGSDVAFLAFGTGEDSRDSLIVRESSGDFRKILEASAFDPALVNPALYSPRGLIRSLLNERGEVALFVNGTLGGVSRDAWFVVDTRSGQVRKIVSEGDEVDIAIGGSRLVFAHFADVSNPGPSLAITQLNLYNPNPWSNRVSITFHQSSGEPAKVLQVGGVESAVLEAAIAPLGSLVVETAGGPTLQKGYVVAESESELGGLEVISTYAIGVLQSQVGVLPSIASRDFAFPVQAQDDQNAGVALVNLSPVEAEITLEARDADGNLVGTASRTLEAGNHLALYAAGELFEDLPELVGTVRVRSTIDLYKMGIRTNSRGMIALPVIE